MSLLITRAGMQATIQARPRRGLRHLGVPAGGAADPLSLALANRLVGNAPATAALEITLSGIGLRFESACCFAITGAPSLSLLNGVAVSFHQTVAASVGDELHINAAMSGARVYLAVAGGLDADALLGSESTYLPAGFGGFHGRALQDNDRIALREPGRTVELQTTPEQFRPPITGARALRTCVGVDIGLIGDDGYEALFDTNFTVATRADRMGMQLQGRQFDVRSAGRLPSAAVFPGSVQCPEDGHPYLLSVDAQTTGGYARIAQVARVDRHVIGQCRPGDHVRLLHRTVDEANADLRDKLDYWRAWLPAIESII